MTPIAQFTDVATIQKHPNPVYKVPVLSIKQDANGNYHLVNWGAAATAYLRKDWNNLPLWAQVWYLQCLQQPEEERITLTFGKGTTRIQIRQSELEDCKVLYAGTERGLYVQAQGQNFMWVGRWLCPLERYSGQIPDGYREVTTTQGIGATAQLFGTKSGAGEKHSLKWGVITALFGRSDITEIQNIEGCFEERMVGYCLPISKELASYFI